MATFTFNLNGGFWNNPASWAPNGIPGNGDTAVFTTAFTCNIDPAFPAVCESLIGKANAIIQSSASPTKAMLTVTGNTEISFMQFTDIDASGGRPIYTWNGVVTGCVNIFTMTDMVAPPDRTVAASFI